MEKDETNDDNRNGSLLRDPPRGFRLQYVTARRREKRDSAGSLWKKRSPEIDHAARYIARMTSDRGISGSPGNDFETSSGERRVIELFRRASEM